MRPTLLAVVLPLLAAAAMAADPVLLASRRGGWMEAFRLDNLETVARIHMPERVEGVEAFPDGQWLFVRAPHPQAPEVCCALFALDTRRLRAFAILWPGIRPVLANGRLFTQRGDDGIDVFDARSLAHLPVLRAPGVYQLAASPDGRWLIGATQFPPSRLDIFDLSQLKLVRQIPAEGQPLRGVWLGSQYYLFAPGLPGAARVWQVDPQAAGLPQPRLVRLADSAACPEPDYQVLAAGDRLAVYSPLSPRPDRIECMAGGYILADPTTAEASKRLAPDLHFFSLIASPDGKILYGIGTRDGKPGAAQLVKLDARSGQTLTARALPSDAWYLTLASIPDEWQGRMDLQAVFQ